MKRFSAVLLTLLLMYGTLNAENFRTIIIGSTEVSAENPSGTTINVGYVDSLLIYLHEDIRFLRGIEIELAVPQQYLQFRGSLATALYADIVNGAEIGVADVNAARISIEPIPGKLQTVYQIPIVNDHGMKASPYASLPAGIVSPSSFPLLIRMMPVIKGLNDSIETMQFQITVRPVFNDFGIVKIALRYPQMLQGKPFTVIIDDNVISNIDDELLFLEGEHNLTVISDDYRNESRRFFVEKSKVLDLAIELLDPTPLVIFALPENTQVFFNNQPVENIKTPYPTVPGEHQVRFQVGDYSIIKSLFIQKGKTYYVDLSIDVNVSEND